MKSLGRFLDEKSSEMKYIVQNSTEFSGLEFFLFEKFVGFYSRKTPSFSTHAENFNKNARKNF